MHKKLKQSFFFSFFRYIIKDDYSLYNTQNYPAGGFMKFSSKPIFIFLILLLLTAQVNAIDLKELQSDIKEFAEDMSDALPFYSTIGLNWSDAYIGNFPSFGMGLSLGLTTMNDESIDKVLRSFGIPFDNLSFIENIGFPLPNYSIDARIGVPTIPLDFGIKFGYLPQSWLKSLLDTGIKSMLIGADVRYALVNSKVIPMRLSVGLGFNYLSGGISKKFENLSFTNGPIDFTLEDPELDIIWKTTSIELKLQASFPYKIITPYAGAGVSYAWSQTGYKVSGSASLQGYNLEQLGIDVSGENFESIIKDSGLNTRVFGGLSFNLAYVRFDLTGMYEIIYGNFGATFGLRFQM
jgi:hypothetical protein